MVPFWGTQPGKDATSESSNGTSTAANNAVLAALASKRSAAPKRCTLSGTVIRIHVHVAVAEIARQVAERAGPAAQPDLDLVRRAFQDLCGCLLGVGADGATVFHDLNIADGDAGDLGIELDAR